MPATLYSEDTSDVLSTSDPESGYVSGRSSQGSNRPDVHFTNLHLVFLNRQLQNLEPQGTWSLPAKLPEACLIQSDGRYITMVHHHHSLFIPDHIVWSYRTRDQRYALKNEDPEASNGGHHILRYTP